MGVATRSCSPSAAARGRADSCKRSSVPDSEHEEESESQSPWSGPWPEVEKCESDHETLLDLPDQLDIRSWLLPSYRQVPGGLEGPAMEESAERADEEAAREMGLSLDFADPEDLYEGMLLVAEEEELRARAEAPAAADDSEEEEEEERVQEAWEDMLLAAEEEERVQEAWEAHCGALDFDEGALLAAEEELRARTLEALVAAEELEEREQEAWEGEARADALARDGGYQQEAAAALALGLSLGLDATVDEAADAQAPGPSPLTPPRRVLAATDSAPPLARPKRLRRSDCLGDQEWDEEFELALGRKRPRPVVKTGMKDRSDHVSILTLVPSMVR